MASFHCSDIHHLELCKDCRVCEWNGISKCHSQNQITFDTWSWVLGLRYHLPSTFLIGNWYIYPKYNIDRMRATLNCEGSFLNESYRFTIKSERYPTNQCIYLPASCRVCRVTWANMINAISHLQTDFSVKLMKVTASHNPTRPFSFSMNVPMQMIT